MRQRLRELSDRDWRTFDRLLVVALVALSTLDLATNSDLEGPLALNIALMTCHLAVVLVAPLPAAGHGVRRTRWPDGDGDLADAAAEPAHRRGDARDRRLLRRSSPDGPDHAWRRCSSASSWW